MILNVQAILLFLSVILVSYPVFGAEILDTLPENMKMKRPARRTRRCRVNICFAIDGSDNLDPWQFRIQRGFVASVVREISEDNKISVAAVQYGLRNRVISPLTKDTSKFLLELRGSTFTDSELSFVGAGVVYCHAQLRNSPGRRAKMVILGTGKSDLGGSPAVRANNFRKDGGEVFAIGVGDMDIAALNKIADGPDNVFYLRRRVEIASLVETFVSNLCQ